jgi:hypothetical protein
MVAPVTPAKNAYIFCGEIRQSGWISGFAALNIPIFEAAHVATTANFLSSCSLFVLI